mmetsp:Transcript_18929/g.30771  ORF Transcript_18929/g.30771 Transcript_18929/m.30771 type:complete len:388 (+) Transcript_18929:178-1341(+)|eukprot:jgi/Bigna1/135911/aug1.31_g10619
MEDTKIQQFVSITGTPVASARTFLTSNNWDVQQAVERFFAADNGAGVHEQSGSGEAYVPPPQPQRSERLLQPVVATRQRNVNSNLWTGTGLANMFKEPEDIMFHGSFEEAADEAVSRNVWLLVNIQDLKEFKCHQLNRDVWGDDLVHDIVASQFVFWQQKADSVFGQWFCGFYKVSRFPYIAAVNPRTRLITRVWADTDSNVIPRGAFAKELHQFLEINPITAPQRKKQKVAERVSSAEEKVLERVLQQSLVDMQEKKKSENESKDRTSSSSCVQGSTGIKEQKQDVVSAALPPEPNLGDSVTTLQLRLPSQVGGKKIRRRFYKESKVRNVSEFVVGYIRHLNSTIIVRKDNLRMKTPFPRRSIENMNATLQDLNLLNAVIVFEITD